MMTFLLMFALLNTVPENVTEFDLSNGIHVISRTVSGGEVEGVSFFLIGGSRVLNESNQGIEAFALEAAMAGSESYPDERWREIMDVTRASWNASYNYDFSRYHLKCLTEDLPLLLDGFADCLLNPELDPQIIERIQNSQLIDLQSELENPDSRVWLVANKGFMQEGHPYLLRPDGVPSTLSSFTALDISNWLTSRIKAGNILITHSGSTSPEELALLLEESFGEIPEGGDVIPEVPQFGISCDTLVLEEEETLSAYVVVKFNAPPSGSEDLAAFSTACGVIDERLWQVLRTENALTYAPGGGSTTSYQQNWGYMYASTTQPVLASTLIREVFADVAAGNIDPAVVTGVANNNRTIQGINGESMGTQCYMLGSSYITSGDWKTSYLMQDALEGTTVEDITRVLNEWVTSAGWGVIADGSLVDLSEFDTWSLDGE